MLLLPIIRDISIRPVHVYTRVTPQISIPPSKDLTPSLIDRDNQDLTYFDIRIKLDRCETDAPARLKKLESHSSSPDEVPSSPQTHEPATEVSTGESSKQVPPPQEGDDAVGTKENPVETSAVSQQKLPVASTLYSIGAMIGTAFYYGANKAPAPPPEAQSSGVSQSSGPSEKATVLVADSPAPEAEENPNHHPPSDEALPGRESEEGRLSDQSISNQSSAGAADRIRERLARLRK
jgi:hypothetical protein